MLSDDQSAACDEIAHRYRLTSRENEILKMIVEGMSTRQIEAALYVSHNTLKSHLLHIHRKLNAHSRDEVLELVRDTVVRAS